jgi:hypothetical protein
VNEFSKISLEMGNVVKFKKLFDFLSTGFYNSRKRTDPILEKEVRER